VDGDGVEDEKGFGGLLNMAETEKIFGPGVVMEMKALLVDHAGPNLRNDLAHGIIADAGAWSASAVFAWWLCLRLVVLPVAAMAAGADESGESVTAKDPTAPEV